MTYASLMTLTTAASRLPKSAPKYVDRMNAFVGDAQRRDLRVTQCRLQAKGDRSLSLSNQDDPRPARPDVSHISDAWHAETGLLRELAHRTGLSNEISKALLGTYCGVPIHAPGRVVTDSRSWSPTARIVFSGIGALDDRPELFRPFAHRRRSGGPRVHQ